jgi:cytochrome oxidase Cu insertion factor (SCO1/SenC/PrrC family)
MTSAFRQCKVSLPGWLALRSCSSSLTRLRSRKRSVAIFPARHRIHKTIRDRLAAHEVGDSVVMKFFLPVIFVALVSTTSFAGIVEDVSPQRGRRVAQINWTDDAGRIRRLSEFAGFPVVLLPIYTRCRTACISNVDQLKKALADSSADPRQFRVLLFSFDSADTPSTLVKYRTRENIPLAWSVGTASQTDIDALLESVGFQYGKAGTEFSHPNLLIFLDSNLRIAKWIYGTDYSGRDVDVALKVAADENDWVGQHSEWLYAILLFAGSLLCVALAYYGVQLMAVRRAIRQAAAN